MHVDDAITTIAPEKIVYVRPGAVQHVENTGAGELVFLCIVDPAWRAEDEEILRD